MKLIVGLGNPGNEYTRTRHNVGFMVLDALADAHSLSFRAKRAVDADVAEGDLQGQRVILCKPQTYMNASGRAVQGLLKKYPLKPEDLLVVYDDADLPFADVRLKAGGGSAGQKGMASILSLFPAGTNIARVRCGIGRPEHSDIPLDVYVLQAFSETEQAPLKTMIQQAIDHVLAYVN